MTLYHKLVTSDRVPWRVRTRLERWVETTIHTRWPAVYRWLHHGQSRDILIPLTRGPRHHFFGYYDKSPWNASGRYMLAHEAGFNDRAPSADDVIGLGLIDLAADNRFIPVAESRAWNWQQGAMLQWHPADADRAFVYNDRRDGRFVAVVQDIEDGERIVYDRPLCALLPDGRTGLSVNFARLALHRPGYGYAGGADPYQDDPHPAEDGLWRVDLESGDAQLIVSLAELAAYRPKPSMTTAWHYMNHVQPSRGGQRVAFFHVWHTSPQAWEVRLYSCRPDGSGLTCLLDSGFISHYDWRDDDTLLVWANRADGGACFQLVSHTLGATYGCFAASKLQEDGHCSFSPDGHWVLNDTYPDQYDKRTLMLVRFADAARIDLARLHSPKSRWWGEIRCDLHPRWSRDGRSVCIDSVHDGTRQMYLIDVERIVS